jgi:uncharacterized protein
VILVDTGVWYALFVPTDADHADVSTWFQANSEPLLTTDFIFDELLTLLRARGEHQIALLAGAAVLDGTFGQLLHVDEVTVREAWDVFRQFSDKDWSFTDCVSYVVIQNLGILTAASLDHHFHQFGSVTVVP